MIRTEELIRVFQQAVDEHWGYIWGAAGKEWTDKLQKQKVQYMVNKYGTGWKNNGEAKGNNYYKAALYGGIWIGHMVADCSGLFVYAFQHLAGIRISHSSHYQYTDYCTEKGTLKNGNRTDGKELEPGTAVFVYNEETKRYSHIGLYIGDGWVIEAAGTTDGVIKSKVTASKWDRWGKLKYVEYSDKKAEKPEDPEHTIPEAPETRKTLRKGDKGDAVKELQEQLIQLGYLLPKYGADGDFGKETESAVKAFQMDNGLNADGVVGAKTYAALDKAKPMQLYIVTIPNLLKHEAEALVKNYTGSKMEEE